MLALPLHHTVNLKLLQAFYIKHCQQWLEKGIANHFCILALRTLWTVWKGNNDKTTPFLTFQMKLSAKSFPLGACAYFEPCAHVRLCVRARVCVCVCVCVWERESKRDRETEKAVSIIPPGLMRMVLGCMWSEFRYLPTDRKTSEQTLLFKENAH